MPVFRAKMWILPACHWTPFWIWWNVIWNLLNFYGYFAAKTVQNYCKLFAKPLLSMVSLSLCCFVCFLLFILLFICKFRLYCTVLHYEMYSFEILTLKQSLYSNERFYFKAGGKNRSIMIKYEHIIYLYSKLDSMGSSIFS